MAVGKNVVRLTAPNAGPFTFHGTNTYLVGSSRLAIIDPGPALPQHFEALMAAIAGRPVSHVFLTHAHRDHCGLLEQLVERTGAKTVAEGPHRAARALRENETNLFEASADLTFIPDIRAADGEVIAGADWEIECVLTPGHTANHAAFALKGARLLFSGDHVMAWATSFVAPPDGSMADYMASLDKLLSRNERTYLPGHGGGVQAPKSYVRALKTHRKMRERAVLQRIRQGDRLIGDIVAAIYRNSDARLHTAAGYSVLAHLEDLESRGLVRAENAVTINAAYFAS